MTTRLTLLPALLALALLLAACGGGSQTVPPSAVAVVNGTTVSLSDYNFWLKQFEARSKVTTGTQAQPSTLRPQVVSFLVQFAELKFEAAKLHVTESQGEVTKFIANLEKTQFQGSTKKFMAWLKTQGLSMAGARQEVYLNQLAGKIKKKVTSSATVTAAKEHQFYTANIGQYETAASTTRSVEYILVKSKSLADLIEQKLHNGATFKSMAQKYSTDKSTGPTGGQYTVTKGQVVPAFESAAFSLKTGQLSAPVNATSAANKNYGWFIIEPLANTVTTKAHKQTFKEAEPSIKQTLLGQAQETLWQQWLSDLQKNYQGKVTYQSGYAPPPTTTAGTTG